MNTYEPQGSEADDARCNRSAEVTDVGAQQARTVHVAVFTRDPHDGDDTLRQAARGLAQGSGDHPPARSRHGVQRPTDDHLDDRGPNAHEEDRFDVLVGEEDALAHEDHAGGGDTRHERGEYKRISGDSLRVPALGCHCDLHHGDRTGHQHRGGGEG